MIPAVQPGDLRLLPLGSLVHLHKHLVPHTTSTTAGCPFKPRAQPAMCVSTTCFRAVSSEMQLQGRLQLGGHMLENLDHLQ